MKSTLSLMIASSALTVVIGFPAMAGAPAVGGDADSCAVACTMSLSDLGQGARLILVDDDEDDDEGGWGFFGGDDDDDDGEDDDDDCDEYGNGDDDDGVCAPGMGNPAPAGTVAPPANGLFGTGAPPVAATN